MDRFISASILSTPARGKLNRKHFFLFLFAPENSVSRDGFGHHVPRQPAHPPNIGLNLVVTDGISRAFRQGVHLYRQPPSGQSQVGQVTQLRTDGVHCRLLAGTGPVVLKIVRGTGAAFLGITTEHYYIFPHHYWYVVVIACVTQEVSVTV